jgi:acetyl esterase/lipase
VVFVPYRTVDISVDHRYQTLWEGFIKAATDYPNIIDTQKVGFMGHSFGGGATLILPIKRLRKKVGGKTDVFFSPWLLVFF